LGLANLPVIPRTEAIAALQQYRRKLAGQLKHVQARRRAQQPLPELVEIMFDYSATLLRAEKRWADRTIKRLEEQDVQD
jgi:hypothetical protein